MNRRQTAIQLVAHQVADRDDERTPYDRTEHVPAEELEERHPARTRHRARHESRAGDKSRHEHRLAAVSLKEKLQAVVTRAQEGKGRREPNQYALSAGAADDVAATVARDRARDYGDVDDSQIEQRAASQESGGEHHGFLGHGNPQVADEHGNEDAEIAPRRDHVRDMRGVGYPMHLKSICREVGANPHPRPRPSPVCRIECASVRDFWLVKRRNYGSRSGRRDSHRISTNAAKAVRIVIISPQIAAMLMYLRMIRLFPAGTRTASNPSWENACPAPDVTRHDGS